MEHFETYIHRVLKQVHPDTRISADALLLMNFIANSLGMHLSHKAILLTQPVNYESKTRKTPLGKKTISSRDIQAATRLILVGELAKHGISQAAKAVTKYTSYASKQKKEKHPVSTASKAGLQLSVSRTEYLLRRHTSLRIGETAPIYLAAVLEYVVVEILELAGIRAKDSKMKTIMPRHVKDAVVEDEELHRLMRHLHLILPGVKDQSHKNKHTQYSDGMMWVV